MSRVDDFCNKYEQLESECRRLKRTQPHELELYFRLSNTLYDINDENPKVAKAYIAEISIRSPHFGYDAINDTWEREASDWIKEVEQIKKQMMWLNDVIEKFNEENSFVYDKSEEK